MLRNLELVAGSAEEFKQAIWLFEGQNWFEWRYVCFAQFIAPCRAIDELSIFDIWKESERQKDLARFF
jgi:hypothetical protein